MAGSLPAFADAVFPSGFALRALGLTAGSTGRRRVRPAVVGAPISGRAQGPAPPLRPSIRAHHRERAISPEPPREHNKCSGMLLHWSRIVCGRVPVWARGRFCRTGRWLMRAP